jgi:acyl-CoA oxidase
LKHFNTSSGGSISSLSYLEVLHRPTSKALQVASKSDWLKPENQRWVLERRLSFLVKEHISDTAAERDTSFAAHGLTMAHCDFVYWKSFWEAISSCEPSLRAPIEALLQVFALNMLQGAHKELFDSYALSPDQRTWLKRAFDDAIEELDKYVKTIIDAYGFTEWEMDSALAKKDKSPYEALWEGAKNSEMNNLLHLRPLIISTREIWKEFAPPKL